MYIVYKKDHSLCEIDHKEILWESCLRKQAENCAIYQFYDKFIYWEIMSNKNQAY